jgi:hypothetical protein
MSEIQVNKVIVENANEITVITVGEQGLQGSSDFLGAVSGSTDAVLADDGGLLIYDGNNAQWLLTTQSDASAITSKIATLTFTAGGSSVSGILDEDDLTSNSATKLATQQSIKAYVDSSVETVNSLSEIIALGNTTSGVDIVVSTDDKVVFRDSAIYINSSADGQLDIVADSEIQIAATTIDINGAVNASGEIAAASLDISGNVDIDGVLEADAITVDGNALVLTANDYTDADHSKLDGIEAGATADQTDAEIRAAVEAASDSNVFTDADHNKLDGIEASADVTDTSNVTSAGALMDSEVTDLAGIKAVTISTLQVKPSEGAFADGDKTKLDGIESNATADQTDAEIRSAVESASDSNVFTDADHSKLDGIEASADVTDSTNVVAALTAGTGITIAANGTIAASPLALTTVQVANSESAQLALTAQEGDVVVRSDENKSYMHNGGTAGTMADYTLLATPTDAVLSVNGNTGAITADQIAAAVEAATDSNTFTDADHSKLNAIEANADVTDVTNVTAAGALMDSELTDLAGVKGVTISTLQVKPSEGAFVDGDKTKLDGIEASATADQTATEIKTLLEDGIDSVHYVDGSIDTVHIGDDQVTADKLANSINSAIAANTAKVSNATHTGEVTGDTALTIADNVVDEANLKVSNSPVNGYALTAQSGATGGLTWAEIEGIGAISDIVEDTTPQLGGDLDLNGNAIQSNALQLETSTGEVYFAGAANGSASLYYDNAVKLATKTDGVLITGELEATTLDVNGASNFSDAITADGGVVGNINGHIKQTVYASVDLTKGDVVYFSGLQGNDPIAALARSNSSSTMPAMGIVTSDVTATNTVEIVQFGSLKGLDVADYGETGITFALGDTVYVSSSEAGKLTNVAPTGEANLIQNIGKIARATPTTNTTINVGGAGRTNATPNLDEDQFFLGNASNQSVAVDFSDAVEGVGDPLYSPIAGSVSIVTTGAINSGSITSGFGSIDNGASAITTTGTITGGTIASTGNITVTGTVDGRDVAADGTKLDGVEASADVTDTTNVTAAGALMDSELTDLAGVKGVTISTLQVKPSEGAFADGDKTKLDGIESSADVTDTTNVVAALTAGTGITIGGDGTIAASPLALTTVQTAVSEAAQLALTAQEGDVVIRSDENKSYMHNGGTAGTMADYTLLATPTDAVLSVNGVTGAVTADHIATAVEAASDSNTFTDADHTKLNAIEASADVTDTTNVTAAGALMDSEVTNLAQVKAFDSADYATAAQGTTADAALPKSGGTMTGTIASFESTGIDDNATSTALTIDSSQDATFAGNVDAKSTTVGGASVVPIIASSDTAGYTAGVFRHNAVSGNYGLTVDFTAASPNNRTNYFLRFDDSSINGKTTFWSDGGATFTGDVSMSKLTSTGSNRGSTSGSIAHSGGSTSNLGGNILMYGESHATLAGDFYLRDDAVQVIGYDKSEALVTVTPNATFAGDVNTSGNIVNTTSSTSDGIKFKMSVNSSNTQGIWMENDVAGYVRMKVGRSGGDQNADVIASHALVLKSADATALTLDTSQNATFAGDVTIDSNTNGATLNIHSPSQVWSGGENLGGIDWYTEDTSGDAPGVIAKMYVESRGSNTLPISEMVFSSAAASSITQIEHLRLDPSGGVSTATFAGDVVVNGGNLRTVSSSIATLDTENSATGIASSTELLSVSRNLGRSTTDVERVFSESATYSLDATNGAEDGRILNKVMSNGTLTQYMRVDNDLGVHWAGIQEFDSSATFGGDINVGGNTIVLGSGVNLKESTHRADLLTIESQTSSWAGIQIDNTADETLWNLMGEGTTLGIYDDTNDVWLTQWSANSETRLYFAGSEKFNTLTGGAHVTGALTATGNITAYSSDERLKDSVPLTDCMSAVNQWEVIRYKWNEKAKKLDEVFEKADDYEVGLSAQSVQRTHPELVSLAPFDRSRDDGSSVSGENYITMDYSRAVSVVAGALQEKDKEIKELKEQVAELFKLVKK